MFLKPSNARIEVRHSSLIGRGVIEPATSSCVNVSSKLSKEKVAVGAVGDVGLSPNNDGDSEPWVLPVVNGGVDIVSRSKGTRSWKRHRE